jgi:GNAT superfamily N-acetyltransferase
MRFQPGVAAALKSGMLELSETPCQADFATIYQALEGATARIAGPAQPRPLAVLLRDDSGAVAGGLRSVTVHSWLAIIALFVPEALRGRGVGRVLVTLAEDAARARGCIPAQVDAFDFQAAGFYERLGFEVFGVQENCPPGHRRLYFAKSLSRSLPSESAE